MAVRSRYVSFVSRLAAAAACALAIPHAASADAVQWRVSEGGNGHWYEVKIRSTAISWTDARSAAEAIGGYLATAEQVAEKAKLFALFGRAASPSAYDGPLGPWLGGYQLPGSQETTFGWYWLTGASFDPTESTCCNNGCGSTPEDRLHLYFQGSQSWNDIPDDAFACGSGVRSYVVEWSADCNNDGIVDYGQILGGQLADADGNGVPDACGYEVPADFPTIQAAIDAVPVGAFGQVFVAPGTYSESFSLSGKNVLVRGAVGGTTILDGTGLATSIARFEGGEPATAGVEQLVFRNGTAGSRVFKGAPFTVGGALYGQQSGASVRACVFEENSADFGGGAYLYKCTALIEDSDFINNSAADEGGGVFCFESTATVRGTTFALNKCGIFGSGSGSGFKSVGARVAGETVLLDSCSVTGGLGSVSGAAVEHFADSGSVAGVLSIVGTSITGNASGLGAAGLIVTGPAQSCVLSGGTSICGNLPRNASGPFIVSGAATVCDCLADLTGDGVVTGGDLGELLGNWGLADETGAGDVNHDGAVDAEDLALMLSAWGACQ